jgi:hypothetical protein
MPQNLEDTEFPGAMPKIAVILWRSDDPRPIVIAPLYTTGQAQHARERAEALGLRVATSASIYSLADLERIEDPAELVPLSLHLPGCIYADTEHPGRDCYVEPGQSETITSEQIRQGRPTPSEATFDAETQQRFEESYYGSQQHAPGCTGLHEPTPDPKLFGQCVVDGSKLI